jgi:hypothetical protein
VDARGSIFEAAHFLEDKPLSGHGFVMDTVPYLAALYNVAIPRLDLNPEDLYEMETYAAYQHAAYVIRNSTPSERVQARLAQYSWSKDVLVTIGIGSVSSYGDYIHKMAVTYDHKLEFLKDAVRVTYAGELLWRQTSLPSKNRRHRRAIDSLHLCVH